MPQLDAEVGQEHHPQAPVHGRIDVDNLGDPHNQTNDQLGHGVAGGRLAAEDHRAWWQILAGTNAQIALNNLEGCQVLTLVFMDAFHLHIEQGGRIHQHPGLGMNRAGQSLLGLLPHPMPALQEAGVAGQGLELAELIKIPSPAVADRLIEQRGERQIGHREPAARRDAIGDIAEPFRPDRGEIMEEVLHQQLAVQLGHTIHLMATDNRQVGHANLALRPLLDQRKLLKQLRPPRIFKAHHAQEAGVDLIDDLQLAGQQLLEQPQTPALQSFRQQGVVGVADRGGGDTPGRIPVDAVNIDQQAHQFRHGDGGMGVVELNGILAVKFRHRQALTQEDPEHVLQGAGHEENLLTQPQTFALLKLVVGIEHLRERFGLHLLEHGAGVIAGIERGEIEGVGCLG